MVSRYDTVTGTIIEVKDRIGLLDRKLRVINENIDNEVEWFELVKDAYKSIYGYEYQGDNLLIARENLLYDFIDNYFYKFNLYPTSEKIFEIAEIISWNIFQMDGVKGVIPNSCSNKRTVNTPLYGDEIEEVICSGCKRNSYNNHNGIYVKVMN